MRKLILFFCILVFLSIIGTSTVNYTLKEPTKPVQNIKQDSSDTKSKAFLKGLFGKELDEIN